MSFFEVDHRATMLEIAVSQIRYALESDELTPATRTTLTTARSALNQVRAVADDGPVRDLADCGQDANGRTCPACGQLTCEIEAMEAGDAREARGLARGFPVAGGRRVMTPTIQHAIRFPTDLHEQITAEAQRLGHPHTFSSVAVNAMRAGLGKGPTPPRPKTTKGQS